MLSGRGLCDELITRPEESYRLCCVVCDLETSRMGVPYIYDISRLRVKVISALRNSGISMYQLLESSGNPHFSNTLYLCVSYDPHNKQRNLFDRS